MGAPTKDIKRDVVKSIRLTTDDWMFIELAAKQAGLSPSAYVVKCVVLQSRLHVDYSTCRF